MGKLPFGGAVVRGLHCIGSWSTTQGLVALSSVEAEYYALVQAAVRGLGIAAGAQEVGLPGRGYPVELYSDSSSARSFAPRRGLCRMRHIETRRFWLRGAVADRRITIVKIAGTDHPGNALTQFLESQPLQAAVGRLRVELVFRPRP